MKFKIAQILFIASFCTIGPPFPTFAEIPLIDPNIPHGETITSTSRTDDRSMTVVENVIIKKDGERELYEITSRSESLDRTLILAKENMSIVSVHTVRKFPEVTLDSKLNVMNEKAHFEKNEIKLADFAVMTYIFRGFPFGKDKTIKIRYYGEERKKKFSFSAKYKDIDNIETDQGTIACHKLEFGMDGFWGTFLPKMNVWYSVAPPHYLVRYNGLVGPPGSPKREMELLRYDVIK
jgi:hypothetical protein